MEETKYLLQITDDGNTTCNMHTPREIIQFFDMIDCMRIDDYHVYDVSKAGKVRELTVCGCWHDFRDPLYIKVCTARGKVVFDGYGTDH